MRLLETMERLFPSRSPAIFVSLLALSACEPTLQRPRAGVAAPAVDALPPAVVTAPVSREDAAVIARTEPPTDAAVPVAPVASSAPGVIVSGLRDVVSLVAGATVACAVTESHAVTCWGDIPFGQGTDSSVGGTATLPGRYREVAVGETSLCALGLDGKVRCWGVLIQDHGECPDDALTVAYDRVQGTGIPRLRGTRLAGTTTHYCATIADGHVWCWGNRMEDLLGFPADGPGLAERTPRAVVGLDHVTDLFVGGNTSFALREDGAVWGWGVNHDNVLLASGQVVAQAAPVASLTSVARIAMGDDFQCVVLRDGAVRCWGANGRGQLGDGTTTTRLAPTAVPGLAGVTRLSLGSAHACALLAAGTVQCWGANGDGQLGDGGTADHHSPAPVPGLAGVTEVTAGGNHTCALLTDRTVRCWGAML